ncbi:MAG TPA: FHA domain-containing protein, partial [Fibrobacteria bacterium]|nr:FHA domain-containing protein [Fibrobacteria bacterium]
MILRNKTTGESHSVDRNIFTAGSGVVNNLLLSGEHVRKIHFQILKSAGQYKLMAMNGTVDVNGQAVGEHVLAHGDELKAGADLFVAEIAAEPPPSEAVSAAAGGCSQGDAYERLLEGVIRLLENPDRRKSAEDILSLGMQLMEADGGYLFTAESGDLSLLCAVPEDNDSYSHSAVKAALRNNETLIWSGTGAEAGEGEVSVQSIEQKNIHSILVSPFGPRGAARPAGLLYLHRKRPDVPFTEPQRKLFSRISQVFGAVLSANQARIDQADRIESLKEIKGSGDLVYASAEMAKVVEAADRASGSNVPVLISGETGTGKDVLANHIHARSPRAGKPFIAVNCGAIPEHLIESELFGHEKGAFTGANRRRPGRF